MSPEFWYYLWAALFVLVSLCALVATLFMLPGNWIIVGLAALFAWLVHGPEGQGLNWWCVGALAGLAVVGEIIEFAAGAAGAAKSGGSRRGMVLALLGA